MSELVNEILWLVIVTNLNQRKELEQLKKVKFIRNQNINHNREDTALRYFVKRRKFYDEKPQQNCNKNQDQKEGGNNKDDKRHRIALGFYQMLIITLLKELKVQLFCLHYMEIAGQLKLWQRRLHRVRWGKKNCQIVDYVHNQQKQYKVLILKIPSKSYETCEIIRDYISSGKYNWGLRDNRVQSIYLSYNTGFSLRKHGNFKFDYSKFTYDTSFKSNQVNNNNKMNSLLNAFINQQILIRFFNIEFQKKYNTVFYHKFGFPYTQTIRIVWYRTCSNTLVPTYNYLSWVILVQSDLFK